MRESRTYGSVRGAPSNGRLYRDWPAGATMPAMQGFHSDRYVLPLPLGHRFPMSKYRLLLEAVRAQLPDVRVQAAQAAGDEELALAHARAYIAAVAAGTLDERAMREIGFPWSPEMVERSRRSCGATLQACRAALAEGVAGNLAGGTHHAYADKGSGFCVFNDSAVATRVLQAEARAATGRALRVAIVDLDVHQGNGTARIFAGDDSVFTLSLHGERNFPFRKEASSLDVGLPDGCRDAEYLAALDAALAELERRFTPDLVIYLAGGDPHEGDRLGRLKLSSAGMAERDRRVFAWTRARRVPTAFSMAGGYGHDVAVTVAVQLTTWRVALRAWGDWQTDGDPDRQT